ncbi:MAG: beta-propeller fold lactonase family protein [Acidobacteriota bacterium]|nr:lactonase family protein [Blastocatellia bacterium]MDW8412159.1 beta-propeller fold lactonase family protein [Acidobacteriota bacterium]
MRCKVFSALLLLFVTAVVQAATKRLFLYVNNNDFENSVSGFEVLPNGTLRRLPGSPFPTGGLAGRTPNLNSIAVSKKGRMLFVTNNMDNTLSGFYIQSDGSLRRFAVVSTGGMSPTGVVSNKRGTRVLVANTGSDNIAVFEVANGQIRPVAGSPFAASNGPVGLVLNKPGTVLFCSNQFTSGVSSFSVDSSGRVKLIGTFPTLGLQQQGLALQRKGALLYVTGMASNTVSVLSVDLNTGQMKLVEGAPFYTDGDKPLDVAVEPGGRFVYVSNSNSGTITAYETVQGGGLRKLQGSPFLATGVGPAGMVFDSSGSLLFVVNGGFGGSKDVSVYKRDSSGRLQPVGSPISTGSIGIPSGITLVELD